jgi:hypothetical protein
LAGFSIVLPFPEVTGALLPHRPPPGKGFAIVITITALGKPGWESKQAHEVQPRLSARANPKSG